MRVFTGFRKRRALARLAGTTALAAVALATWQIATPAQAADLDYDRYGERAYEYEEYRAPPRVRYREQPYAEYRVRVYPPRATYAEPYDDVEDDAVDDAPVAYVPPRRIYTERVYVEPEPPRPPAPVGFARRTVIVDEAPPSEVLVVEPPPRW